MNLSRKKECSRTCGQAKDKHQFESGIHRHVFPQEEAAHQISFGGRVAWIPRRQGYHERGRPGSGASDLGAHDVCVQRIGFGTCFSYWADVAKGNRRSFDSLRPPRRTSVAQDDNFIFGAGVGEEYSPLSSELENSTRKARRPEKHPSGAKALALFAAFTARLKSCPFTNFCAVF